jgi:hypothetical protein
MISLKFSEILSESLSDFNLKQFFWGFRIYFSKRILRCSKILSENYSKGFFQGLKSLSEQLFWNQFGNVSEAFWTLSEHVLETVSENTARTFVTPCKLAPLFYVRDGILMARGSRALWVDACRLASFGRSASRGCLACSPKQTNSWGRWAPVCILERLCLLDIPHPRENRSVQT